MQEAVRDKLAKKWRCSIGTVTAWEAEGAPFLNGDKAMRDWLKTRRSVPRGTAEVLARQYGGKGDQSRSVSIHGLAPRRRPAKSKTQVDPDTNGHEKGAAAALRRLEQSEIRAYVELEDLLNDPDTTTKEVDDARSAWLKTSDALRRYDIAVEQARRDSGDLIPREILEVVAKGLVVNITGPMQAALEALCPRLAGLQGPVQVWHVLGPAYRKALQSAFKAMCTHPYNGKNAPDWLVKAVQDAMSANIDLHHDAIMSAKTESDDDSTATEAPVVPN